MQKKIFRMGIVIPSTNSSVEPEMESMRPYGVTNHFSRMKIPDNSIVDRSGFQEMIDNMKNSADEAIRSIITCLPDEIIIGVSPDVFWNGKDGYQQTKDYFTGLSGNIGITMSPDAIRSALSCYGEVRKIAIISGYSAIANKTVERFFVDSGYEVVCVHALGGASPTHISHSTNEKLRDAIIEVNRPEVEVIVQVGTNASMGRLAAIAETWLGKPVIANSTALYWYALRKNGIKDPVRNLGSLLELN